MDPATIALIVQLVAALTPVIIAMIKEILPVIIEEIKKLKTTPLAAT